MKLFSWAHRKLLHKPSPEKKHLNPDICFDLPKVSNEDLQAKTRKDRDVEILTIGTLGMCNLLNMHANDEDNDANDEDNDANDDDDDDDNDDDEKAHNVRADRRESVSSMDIQKLQEELQKILYFKLGEPLKSEKEEGGGLKRKNDKNNSNNNNNNTNNIKNNIKNNDGRLGERRTMFPLHNFLEIPMDAPLSPFLVMPMDGAPPPLLHKKQLLLQSFRKKLLHCTSFTRASVSPSLFDKLKAKTNIHHGSKIDKLLQLFRRMNASHKCRKNNEENSDDDGAGDGDDRLKLAVNRGSRGSERFISYMSKLADMAEHHNQLHCTADHEGQVQLLLNSPPANECWIKTDDEYLVLEL